MADQHTDQRKRAGSEMGLRRQSFQKGDTCGRGILWKLWAWENKMGGGPGERCKFCEAKETAPQIKLTHESFSQCLRPSRKRESSKGGLWSKLYLRVVQCGTMLEPKAKRNFSNIDPVYKF